MGWGGIARYQRSQMDIFLHIFRTLGELGTKCKKSCADYYIHYANAKHTALQV